MRTKPARRWHSPSEHNSYGIYNWFLLNGIKAHDIVDEVVYIFCQENGFKGLNPKTPDKTKHNFVGNRFQRFAPFAMKYLRENNYIPESHKPIKNAPTN